MILVAAFTSLVSSGGMPWKNSAEPALFDARGKLEPNQRRPDNAEPKGVKQMRFWLRSVVDRFLSPTSLFQ
jgi:hypothetical protein